MGRGGGTPPQAVGSGLLGRSLPNEPLPPLIPYGAPRGGGTYPRGPAGGILGPRFSPLL